MEEVESMGEYEKQEKALKEKLKKIGKGSGSKILKNISVEEKMRDDKEAQMRCRIIRKVVDEALDMYREGEMNFESMKEDIKKALDAVD